MQPSLRYARPAASESAAMPGDLRLSGRFGPLS